jgi:hypothetical protein
LKRFAALSTVIACALLAACSTVQLAYNNADWWLLQIADDYLDLNGEQRQRLRTALATRLDQHRRQELEGYVSFFDRAARAAEQGLTRPEAEALVAELEANLQTTVAGTIPVFAPVMAGLSKDQREHLAQRMDEENRKFRETHLQEDRDARLQARAERSLGRIERWTGRLSRRQQQRVIGIIRGWPDAAADWYAYRIAQEQGLLRLLGDGVEAEQITVYLRDWWVEQARQPPALRRAVRQTREGLVGLLLALDASLTPKQREHLVREAIHYHDALRELLPPGHPRVAEATIP